MIDKLPAKTGWIWVKEGFALFRKQSAEISTLFLSYMFLMLALGIIPVVGQLLPLILVPVFCMSFMQACFQIEQGKRVYPNLLLAGFRSPALRSLLLLGILNLLALTIAAGVSSLIDGGMFWKVTTGSELDINEISNSHIQLAMLVAFIVYIPAIMAFWYAAPLITWQKMTLGKALFYSFFSVLRTGKAFILYALAWLAIGIILPAIVSTIIALLINSMTVMIFILMPLSMILTIIMYCSFYPTYTHLFGQPTPDVPA